MPVPPGDQEESQERLCLGGKGSLCPSALELRHRGACNCRTWLDPRKKVSTKSVSSYKGVMQIQSLCHEAGERGIPNPLSGS